VTFTGEPDELVPFPNVHVRVGVPLPANVQVAPLHDADVIVAGLTTVTGPTVEVGPQPTLLQARTA
jgi:hypothetical protein